MPMLTERDVNAYRELARLHSGDHITLHAFGGFELEVLVHDVHAGDSPVLTEAYVTGVERNTRVSVTLKHYQVATRYHIRSGWKDDAEPVERDKRIRRRWKEAAEHADRATVDRMKAHIDAQLSRQTA